MRSAAPSSAILIGMAALIGAPAWSQDADVGYYDMSQGRGSTTQVDSIVTGGGTPVLLEDLSEADLEGIDVLYVQNPSNSAFGSEYLARLASIEEAVDDGMRLIIHDRFVTTAASILPGGSAILFTRETSGTLARDIDIVDDTTLVTDGPGGVLDDTSLDGGSSSTHGFADIATLPMGTVTILSRPSPSEAVTFCYEFGRGAVTYSTIPLDFYLAGQTPAAFSQVYAPNVVAYGIDGACGGTATPPIDASDELPYELFGTPLSTIVNPKLAELVLEPGSDLVGRTEAFSLVVQLSAGAFAFPLPTAGPPGSGSDLELGPALAGWSMALASGATGDDRLIYDLAPPLGATPVGPGLALSVQPGALRISDLDVALDEAGLFLAVDFDFEDLVADDRLQSFGVGIVETVEGVTLEVTDTEAAPELVDEDFLFRSEPISIGTTGVCSGFPDGGLFLSSPNCSSDGVSDGQFQLDPVNDRIRVVVSGDDVSAVLVSTETSLSLHAGTECDPGSELASVNGPIPPAQPNLTFSLAPTFSELSLCLVAEPGFNEARALDVEVSVQFSSIFLRPPAPASFSFGLLPRCFGDLNEDRIVNNLDLLLFRSCFPCTGPGCDPICDSNADGNINNQDVLALIEIFGGTCPGF